MELIVATRGFHSDIDRFIEKLKGVFLPYKRDGKDMIYELGLKPYQIYGITFPKEHKDLILATIVGKQEHDKKYDKFDKYLRFLRKILGLKPLGEWKSDKVLPAHDFNNNTDWIPLGIKEDVILPNGNEEL